MPCEPGMTFEECEMTMLREAVEDIEKHSLEGRTITDVETKITKIVERYLRDTENICYGGTAINALLPKSAQFYDSTKEMPDYDFYSMTPLDDVKELSDIFVKEGFVDVEAKAGVHYGTFKIFVNRIPSADITMMHEELFQTIKKESIVIDGIYYAPPDLLRQSMYLEMSRPNGMISRWEKVYSRLLLLNKHRPIDELVCKKVSVTKPHHSDLYYLVRDTLIELDVVFMGGYADLLYIHYMDKQNDRFVNALPDFDVLSEKYEKTCNTLMKVLRRNHFEPQMVKHYGELGGEHYQIIVDDVIVATIYEPIACHSYNTIRVSGKDIHVATIDTLLSYYLIFIYLDRPYYDRQKIMCMATLLFEIQKEYRLSNRGLLKRFSSTCYGRQKDLDSMRTEKAEMKLKLRGKKGTREYDMWFLFYNPASNEHRTKELLKLHDKEEKKARKSKSIKKEKDTKKESTKKSKTKKTKKSKKK